MRYMFLGSYTANALKGIIQGSDREAAVKALLDTVGGELISLSLLRGEYDIVAVTELPEANDAMGLTLAIKASGAFTKISVHEELDMVPVIALARKAAKVYEPAG